MKIKNIIFSLLFFITSINYAQECLVTAKSGLNVREKPNPTSKKIGKLNYNEKVTIVENTSYFLEVNDEHHPIEGYWVKIESENGIEGYVFEGYLELIEKLNLEFLDFLNNESFEMITQHNNKWVNHSSCYHNFTFEIKGRLLYRGVPQDDFINRITAIKKSNENLYKVKLLWNNEWITIKILDKSKKIIEIEERRYVPKSIFKTYEKIETKDGCYD